MKVAQWAEIRRLAEVEKLSRRAIARRLRCCERSVKKALDMSQPPDETRRAKRGSILDPYKPKIQTLIAKCPELSAMRVLEELRKGPEPYGGRITVLRGYLRQIRPRRGRIYQEVYYEPGQAMQVDWGHCGAIRIGKPCPSSTSNPVRSKSSLMPRTPSKPPSLLSSGGASGRPKPCSTCSATTPMIASLATKFLSARPGLVQSMPSRFRRWTS